MDNKIIDLIKIRNETELHDYLINKFKQGTYTQKDINDALILSIDSMGKTMNKLIDAVDLLQRYIEIADEKTTK